ncbi:MAG TPA: hypothetical protein VGH28_02975 [Polyangiaceae bacterium]|jgi:hypothetical protein
MKRRLVPRIEHAVLLALAACGTSAVKDDAGSDGAADATIDATADAPDDASLDASADDTSDEPTQIVYLPLPDGCVTTGKPDAFAPCGYTEFINDPNACQVDIDADVQDAGECNVLCSADEPDCVYYDLIVGEGGHEYLINCGQGCIGRLHERARDDVAGRCAHVRFDRGAWLAESAALEAASVDAFAILARELERFGAPAHLARGARRAARDEVRHARITAILAERFGASAHAATSPESRVRDRRTFAIENAVEGCVRETFGAALAAWQAARAKDAVVRDAMREIARDEARHAELGWRIDAWLASVSSEDDRRAIEHAKKDAVRALRESASVWGEGDEALGLPSASEATRLLAELDAEIWA